MANCRAPDGTETHNRLVDSYSISARCPFLCGGHYRGVKRECCDGSAPDSRSLEDKDQAATNQSWPYQESSHKLAATDLDSKDEDTLY
jgi:hypothetical protein